MSTAASTTAPPSPGHDPWARWGWIMGAAWIVFLFYPITAVLASPVPVAQRVLTLLAIVAFAALYVTSFVRMMRDEAPPLGSAPMLGILIVLALATAPTIGGEAIGMSPYLVSYAMFGFSWPRSPVVAGVLLVLSLSSLLLPDQDGLWFFVILLPLIFGFTLLVRVLNHWGDRHAELSRQVAVVGERERVARDVHDVLGHSLTAITVKVELAERMVDLDPERAKAELSQVRRLTRDSLAELRSTVAGLRATRVESELESARDALRSAGITAVAPDTADDVDPVHRIVLGWALRESVTNVIRHSSAQRCVIELGSACLVVTDDGVGPAGYGGSPRQEGLVDDRHPGHAVPADADDPVAHVEGNGLRGLRERVAASGGSVTLSPGPDGHGTRLEVRL